MIERIRLALLALVLAPTLAAAQPTSFYDSGGVQKYAREGSAGLPVQLYTLDGSGNPQPLRIGTTGLPSQLYVLDASNALQPVKIGTTGVPSQLYVLNAGGTLTALQSGSFSLPAELPDSAVVGGTLTKSTKTTAYTSGMLIAQSATAGSCSPITLAVARASDKTGMVRRVRLKVNDAAWLNATVRVHLFRDSPTFSNGDAGSFAAGVSESNYLGYADVTLDQSFSDPAVKGIGVPAAGGEFNFVPASGTANIFAVLEARSTTGTVTASSTWTATVEVLRN